MKRKAKILALHSFRTSGAIFKDQLQRSGILQDLEDLIEITFVDAPNPASGPIPDDVAPFFSPPYFEWWNAERNTHTNTWEYKHALKSLAYIEDIAALHGPFDALIGFSQGAAMVSLVAALQKQGKVLQGQPMLRFIICFAGIRVRDPNLQNYYDALKSGIPSLHIIGDKDPVKHMTNDLIASFEEPEPIVINHSRGHVIASMRGDDLQRLRSFIEKYSDEGEVASGSKL